MLSLATEEGTQHIQASRESYPLYPQRRKSGQITAATRKAPTRLRVAGCGLRAARQANNLAVEHDILNERVARRADLSDYATSLAGNLVKLTHGPVAVFVPLHFDHCGSVGAGRW